MKSKRLSKLLSAQRLAQIGVIYAPVGFLLASPDRLLEVCNGCGAADSWFRPPSKIYGTSISDACNVHDWMYEVGRTIEDKDEADRAFLNNMLRLIKRDRKKWYKPSFLQRKRACAYYAVVKYGGGPAFWQGKN